MYEIIKILRGGLKNVGLLGIIGGYLIFDIGIWLFLW